MVVCTVIKTETFGTALYILSRSIPGILLTKYVKLFPLQRVEPKIKVYLNGFEHRPLAFKYVYLLTAMKLTVWFIPFRSVYSKRYQKGLDFEFRASKVRGTQSTHFLARIACTTDIIEDFGELCNGHNCKAYTQITVLKIKHS